MKGMLLTAKSYCVFGVPIGPKGGPLEKNFFETCLHELKIIVLMKENVFDDFKPEFEA